MEGARGGIWRDWDWELGPGRAQAGGAELPAPLADGPPQPLPPRGGSDRPLPGGAGGLRPRMSPGASGGGRGALEKFMARGFCAHILRARSSDQAEESFSKINARKKKEEFMMH